MPAEIQVQVATDQGQAYWNLLVEQALRVLYEAQSTQLDKAGRAYVMHPIRVAARMHPGNAAGQIVALLHDCVEDAGDKGYSLDALAMLFPARIIKALDAISKRPQETYAAYLDRVCADSLARLVKRADLLDNMDPRRHFAGADGLVEGRYVRTAWALTQGPDGKPLGWQRAGQVLRQRRQRRLAKGAAAKRPSGGQEP